MRGKLLYAIFCSTFRYAFSNFVGIKGSRPQKKTEFYEIILQTYHISYSELYVLRNTVKIISGRESEFVAKIGVFLGQFSKKTKFNGKGCIV